MTRVLILCAGSGARWGNYLGAPKQLVPVENHEPLLHRTVRELLASRLHDVHIVATEAVFNVPGCSFYVPRSHRWIVETLLETESIWGRGKTIVLLGDVWYSRSALDSVRRCTRPYQFFGRVNPSSYTGKGAEIFALLFTSDRHDELRRILIEAIRFAEEMPYSVEVDRALAMVFAKDKLSELQRMLEDALQFAERRSEPVEATNALALFFSGERLEELRKLAHEAGHFAEAGPCSIFESERARGKLWSVQRLWAGTPLSQMNTDVGFQVIDDLTEDFDDPEEYDRWMNAKRQS